MYVYISFIITSFIQIGRIWSLALRFWMYAYIWSSLSRSSNSLPWFDKGRRVLVFLIVSSSIDRYRMNIQETVCLNTTEPRNGKTDLCPVVRASDILRSGLIFDSSWKVKSMCLLFFFWVFLWENHFDFTKKNIVKIERNIISDWSDAK